MAFQQMFCALNWAGATPGAHLWCSKLPLRSGSYRTSPKGGDSYPRVACKVNGFSPTLGSDYACVTGTLHGRRQAFWLQLQYLNELCFSNQINNFFSILGVIKVVSLYNAFLCHTSVSSQGRHTKCLSQKLDSWCDLTILHRLYHRLCIPAGMLIS